MKKVHYDCISCLDYLSNLVPKEDGLGQFSLERLYQFVNNSALAAENKARPFAKLYAQAFLGFTRHYQSLPDSDNPIAQKELNRVLDQPLDLRIEELTTALNFMLLESAVKAGQSKVRNEYTPEEVKSNLLAMAGKALIEYADKP